MNKDLRDYLLEMYCTINAMQNKMSNNPMSQIINIHEIRVLAATKYRTAKIYHALADEKDLSLLDEDGFPTDFQLKRINKIIADTHKEFEDKFNALQDGDRRFISMRHGDIIELAKKEPSKCDDCGHVHD